MGDKGQEYLSAEELRNRLYHNLRNRGLVDSIKSQLRKSLVTELKQNVEGPLSIKDLKVPEDGSFLHQASNSLVANHLKACNYEYTLSVFLPDCGLNQEKNLNTTDLLKLLNISPHSRLYDRLSTQLRPETRKGFLWQLLSEISSLHANSSTTVSCQTDHIKVGVITPLDEKMSDVDKFYSSQREDFLRSGKVGAEQRLSSFQHQLEDRYNTQLKMELARMKDAEIATIRIGEKESSRKVLEQAKKELECTYRAKHDALLQRETNAMERLQQQTDIQERETYAQRQTILEEIDAVRQREIEVKREAEVNKREKKLLEDRLKDKADNLRRRELEVTQKETTFEQRLQNEMAQFKLDQQARFIDRIQNVEVREATLKEQERILSEEKARMQQIKDELRDKRHRVNELETFLSEAKHQEINATKNNEYLNAKLRDMSDYNNLKEQVILYRNELETVRTRLAEVLSMNERERGRQEELLRELRRPSPECLMLQRDLERAKEELRQEQVVFCHQKQLLEARLKEELDRTKDVFQRFEEQTLQMKDMNREIVDLRQHLHITNKALTNEVYRSPSAKGNSVILNKSRQAEGEGVDSIRHSVAFDLPVDDTVPRSHQFDLDPEEVYRDIDLEPPRMPQTMAAADLLDDDASSLDSGDIIAHTKCRLQSLDKEAQNLENAYSDFHHRMTNFSTVPNDQLATDRRIATKTPHHHHQLQRLQQQPSGAKPVLMVASPVVDYSHHSLTMAPVYPQPMSSTPYGNQRRPSPDLNDSFTELTTHSHRQSGGATTVTIPLDLSAVGDEATALVPMTMEVAGDERHVGMRSITMEDLEQRPGSPSVMVMAGSESSHSHSQVAGKQLANESVEVTGKAMSSPSHVRTDTMSAGGFSLDTAWKSQLEEDSKKDQEAEIRQREMEERLRQQEDNERRRLEEEKQREKERQTAQIERDEALAKAQEQEDKIDPVMKQYMAMVQQQKEKEREDKTPSYTDNEEDLSVAVEDKSEQEGDDGFSW